ncbi:hypothetical protein [Candidatus Albibeggiatoa sp. nov. BB20]|uniref:hypothetical protein n=1 Tax=Candidatus Albibeggiatoa sp. nov. BB20 TaxID=3162723 RepID=UPI00336595E6
MATRHLESSEQSIYSINLPQELLNKLTHKIDELSIDLNETPNYPLPPRYFTTSDAQQIDLSNVHVLHQGVDTIKQLYEGIPHVKTFLDIEYEYKNKIGALVNIQTKTGNYQFILGSGGKSGYMYRLQNNELGIIIFFCTRFKKLEIERDEYDGLPRFTSDSETYSHLKIECSPHLLCSTSVNDVQSMLDSFASAFLNDWKHSGVAAHLCVDVMGWDIPQDFEQRFICRSKKNYRHSGIQNIELEQGQVAVIYGRTETLTYGSATSTQFTIYNKTLQSTKTDKLEFWEEIWGSNSEIPELPSPYQSGQTVRRFEVRFHHNVIDQFSAYLAQNPDDNGVPEIKSYAQLSYYIPSLWLYGMTSYRLQYSSTFIDPMWTILMTQVNWGVSQVKVLKREYGVTKKDYSPAIDRLIALYLGCTLSLYARKGYYADEVIQDLQKQGIFSDILRYYEQRYHSWDYHEVILNMECEFEERLTKRRLIGNAVC